MARVAESPTPRPAWRVSFQVPAGVRFLMRVRAGQASTAAEAIDVFLRRHPLVAANVSDTTRRCLVARPVRARR